MTDERSKQIQEIEALLAERRKYEQWIAQLDARKESTPSHVFVKVHRDYTMRLTEAQEKLSSESGAVHALATELETSLAKQEREITERTDERAEAELRASVGEFAGKEWEKLRGKLDSAIAELTGERDAVQRELDTLRALLTEAEPPKSGEPARDVDDIAFLRSVLGRNTPYSSTPLPPVTAEAAAPPPPPPPPSPPAERPPAPAPRASVPVEKRPSVQQQGPIAEAITEPSTSPERASVREAARASTGAPVQRASSANVARPSTAGAPVRKTAPELFATPEVPAAPSGPRGTDDERQNRPSGTFGQPTPRTSEALKSLKCQECGTLNFPTEWYCERCGGELAAF